MKKKIIKTALYIRSTAVEPIEHISNQIKECIAYCKTNDLTIVDCFIDVGSSIDKRRPGLVDLLALIRTETLGALVVTSYDRLFRDETISTQFFTALGEHKITLHLSSNIVTSKESFIEEVGLKLRKSKDATATKATESLENKHKIIHSRLKKK
jgi:DNA invertase Pin-like site-specific DNA recombinase